MRHPERCVNVPSRPVDDLHFNGTAHSPATLPAALQAAPAARLGALGLALALLSGCASPTCSNPYVLDFLDHADRQADLAHVGLLRGSARTAPGAGPDQLSCSIWEQIRTPGTRAVQLRPQYYQMRHVSDGWQIAP
jgi:hypothetical protein